MKLQSYQQHKLKSHRHQKLHLKYTDMFEVMEKIGPVACRFDHPEAAIHPVIHVSQLKLAHGGNKEQISLPSEVWRQNIPEVVHERMMVKGGNKEATKILVKWMKRPHNEATWRFLDEFKMQF